MMPEPLKIAFIVGGHGYDVPALHDTLYTFQGMRFYPQTLTNLAADYGKCLEDYAAFVFYGMPRSAPTGKEEAFLIDLPRRGQGIVVLHHALLGYPGWQPWTELTGMANHPFKYYEPHPIELNVINPIHPITQTMDCWRMTDETYILPAPECDARSTVLVTTDDPLSMRSIAWTRRQSQARVFCCALGHDAIAYETPEFQTLLQNGIRWATRVTP